MVSPDQQQHQEGLLDGLLFVTLIMTLVMMALRRLPNQPCKADLPNLLTVPAAATGVL